MTDAMHRTPAVEFEHVTKAFGTLRVLDDVSFRIERAAASAFSAAAAPARASP